MTTEQKIAELEAQADRYLADPGYAARLEALVLEVRALRLMLRDEIREAAWRLKPQQSYCTCSGFSARGIENPDPDCPVHFASDRPTR